jgi:hypothetical protein
MAERRKGEVDVLMAENLCASHELGIARMDRLAMSGESGLGRHGNGESVGRWALTRWRVTRRWRRWKPSVCRRVNVGLMGAKMFAGRDRMEV